VEAQVLVATHQEQAVQMVEVVAEIIMPELQMLQVERLIKVSAEALGKVLCIHMPQAVVAAQVRLVIQMVKVKVEMALP
jgi:hypothetical protein